MHRTLADPSVSELAELTAVLAAKKPILQLTTKRLLFPFIRIKHKVYLG